MALICCVVGLLTSWCVVWLCVCLCLFGRVCVCSAVGSMRSCVRVVVVVCWPVVVLLCGFVIVLVC